jgi:hypothetical protein
MRSIALLVLIAAGCRAENACPFLNAATAAGVLGGEVSSRMNGDICVFTHESSELRIEVQNANLPYKPNCPSNATSLKAIGNEAYACSVDGKNGTSEQVVGRVRDRAFLIRITSNSIPRAALCEKVRSVAEQVAGILF